MQPESEALRAVVALIGEEGLAQARRPLDQPSGLPNAAYWSKDWLQLEQQRIFQRSWIFAGAEAELPEPGAILPLEIAGTPILLLRDEAGRVRAFHNVCRHRGTKLVDAACMQRSITCPYHAWNYRLDGSLRSRPHFRGPNRIEQFAGEEAQALGLYPIQLETWNGCLFIKLKPGGLSFKDWLAPMLERTQAFDFSLNRWIGKRSYRIKSNWKLVLENYMEGYHVFAAHPKLIKHAPMKVRWSGAWLEHVFYNDYVAPEISQGRGDALPHYPGLADADRRRGMWFACWPNFAAEVYADQFVVLASSPIAPDETLEELHFFVAGEAAAEEERYAEAREALTRMWHELNLEDVALLERLQQGRRSIAFQGALMSPAWEGPAHQLAQRVLEALLTA